MPSLRAVRVMTSANRSSLPPRPRPAPTAASLADRSPAPGSRPRPRSCRPAAEPELGRRHRGRPARRSSSRDDRSSWPDCERAEGQVEGHHLGQRCRDHRIVGIARVEDRAGSVVDQDDALPAAPRPARRRCDRARPGRAERTSSRSPHRIIRSRVGCLRLPWELCEAGAWRPILTKSVNKSLKRNARCAEAKNAASCHPRLIFLERVMRPEPALLVAACPRPSRSHFL